MINEATFDEPTTSGSVVSSRRRFNYEQTQKLLDEFYRNRNPSKGELEIITSRVFHHNDSNADLKRVNQWYQNRRARENKKRWLRIKNLVTDEDGSDSNLSCHFSPPAKLESSSAFSSPSSMPKTMTKQDIITALETVNDAFSIMYDDATTEILRDFQQEFLLALPN